MQKSVRPGTRSAAESLSLSACESADRFTFVDAISMVSDNSSKQTYPVHHKHSILPPSASIRKLEKTGMVVFRSTTLCAAVS